MIETVDRLKAELPRLKEALPPAVKLTLVHDRTGTIRASIHDVQLLSALASGSSCWSAALPALDARHHHCRCRAAVPLIATFGVIWYYSFSLDEISLMALTIGAGFVVDDAIVMIEDVVRHLEKASPQCGPPSTARARYGLAVRDLAGRCHSSQMSLPAAFS